TKENVASERAREIFGPARSRLLRRLRARHEATLCMWENVGQLLRGLFGSGKPAASCCCASAVGWWPPTQEDMNKGTALVGFLLCFAAGLGMMWSLDRAGPARGFDSSAIEDAYSDAVWSDEDAAVPIASKDATWGSRTAP